MSRFAVAFTLAASVLVVARAAAADLPSALVEPYLQVQVALAGDQFDAVAQPAKRIEAAAAALGPRGESLLSGARKLVAARDIETARTAFGVFSQELIAYAEKTKSGLGPDVHLAYCPMVDKHWLQKGADIKNPYYGSSMLTCGSIKK